ncbi:hypothetical protein GCM10027347_11920 [Larkinella harenae]
MVLAFATVVTACKQDDPPLPDNLVQFEATEQGFESDKADTDVKLTLSRAVDAATAITIDLAATGIAYGTQFTTNPAATNNSLTVSIPAGSNTGSFKVVKGANLFLNGTESIKFTIKSAASPVLVGEKKEATLKFSSIVSAGSQLKLEGGEGGAAAVNSVFVDFSTNSQKAIARNSWDFGFASGSAFRVIVNNTTGASVWPVNKTDLAQVTSKDVVADSLAVGQAVGSFKVYDNVNGDLTKTAIAEISANDADNKVYIVNRVGGSGQVPAVADLIKIRVLRKGTGYTLQYAKINETTFKTLDVAKDAAYNFNYVSFDKGAVDVEPAKTNWDIQWTYSLFYTMTFPYSFSDLVFVNHLGGVQAAEVLTSTVSYDNYGESNIATTTFKGDRNVISSNWRVTSGATVGVKTDRFYVIKDAAGNVYKLKFLNFHSADGGVRGYPNIEYKLVKKA